MLHLFLFSGLFACRNTKDITDSGIYTDADGDGVTDLDDCNDSDPTVSPNSEELCDGVDNNCDGQIDEGVLLSFYLDQDGDGYGTTEELIEACQAPEGYAEWAEDCNDADVTTYPDAPEQCDGIDNDCDPETEIDEGVVPRWYLDEDEDGFGDPDAFVDDCNPGEGYVANADDCNDLYANVYPGADEYCDDLDNDCDEEVDENAVDPLTWFEDTDGDGYGVAAQTVEACEQPQGYAAVDGDCAPDDATVSPTAAELCDGIANVCGGALPAEELDDDGDGYVECSTAATSWAGAANVVGGSDCDDANATISPGATELCDGIANICGSAVPADELDDDGDGQVECSYAASGWVGSASVSSGDDCDDTDSAVFSGAPALCDGQYNDCNHVSYNAATSPTDEVDDDGDGQVECAGWVGAAGISSGDCHDGDNSIYSSAAELCDGKFNDCDDALFSYVDPPADESDDDADGQVECSGWSGDPSFTSGDCDDTDAAVYSGATELCDGLFNDCSDANYSAVTSPALESDDDSDGYVECALDPTLWVNGSVPAGGLDCDDGNPSLNMSQGGGCSMGESCLDILDNTSYAQGDGTYTIDPDGAGGNSAINAYCDMSIDGGGWTLFGNIVSGGFDYASSTSQTDVAVTLADNLIGPKPNGSTPRLRVEGSGYSFDLTSSSTTAFQPSSDNTYVGIGFDQVLQQSNASISAATVSLSTSQTGYCGGAGCSNGPPGSFVGLIGGWGSVVNGFSFTYPTGCSGANVGMYAVVNQSVAGGFNVKNTMDYSQHVGCSNGTTGVVISAIRLYYR